MTSGGAGGKQGGKITRTKGDWKKGFCKKRPNRWGKKKVRPGLRPQRSGTKNELAVTSGKQGNPLGGRRNPGKKRLKKRREEAGKGARWRRHHQRLQLNQTAPGNQPARPRTGGRGNGTSERWWKGVKAQGSRGEHTVFGGGEVARGTRSIKWGKWKGGGNAVAQAKGLRGRQKLELRGRDTVNEGDKRKGKLQQSSLNG